jgi:hypothetical protein
MERISEGKNAQGQDFLERGRNYLARRATTIKELNAMEELYGSRMTSSKVMRIIFKYELAVCGMSYFLYQNLIATFMYGFAGAIYVYMVIIKQDVESRYRQRGLFERNKFINFITQSMTAKNAQMLPVLMKLVNKLEGEFKDDVQHLVAVLCTNSTSEEKNSAFAELSEKYRKDIYFCLFLDQVQTVYLENTYHIETFREFQRSHNLILIKQKEYQRIKDRYRHWFFLTLIGAFGLLVLTAYATGIFNGNGMNFEMFTQVYATSLIGRIVSTFYMVAMAIVVNIFFRNYYDDNITEM